MWKYKILFHLFLSAWQVHENFAISNCGGNDIYRSFNGTCNNVNSPTWGSAKTPYTRLLKPSYSNGVHEFQQSKLGGPLLGPRAISLEVYKYDEVLDQEWTLLTVAWGQTIAHDMSFTAIGYTPACCKGGKYTPGQSGNPTCAIKIPANDPYIRNECIAFFRTNATNNIPNQPITAVTHFMDLSIIYGESDEEADSLREDNGRLKSAFRHGAEWLSQSKKPNSDCFLHVTGQPCYKGDLRVNQNTPFTYLQVLFMREHNRIASQMCASLLCKYTSEKCYQEARRIVIAMYQHITYNEYLPLLLGKDNMVQNKLLYPGATDYVNDYDPSVDPSVAVEHATAAFRSLHSSIPGHFDLFPDNPNKRKTLELSKYMNIPAIIEEGDNAAGLARCLYTQHQEMVDKFYSFEVTNLLFRNTMPRGTDLRATDIQRSRDHGVGTYCNALKTFKLSNCRSFDDLRTLMPDENVRLLQSSYRSVEDVELTVGAGLEPNFPHTMAGPTNRAIMTRQFLATRRGDRYFYENGNQPKPFTPEQLNSIRKATVAAMICNNGDGVTEITRKAFDVISPSNPIVPCSQIPQVDLSLFKPDDQCVSQKSFFSAIFKAFSVLFQ